MGKNGDEERWDGGVCCLMLLGQLDSARGIHKLNAIDKERELDGDEVPFTRRFRSLSRFKNLQGSKEEGQRTESARPNLRTAYQTNTV
eukprot:2968901-Rhodomonas_salina.2